MTRNLCLHPMYFDLCPVFVCESLLEEACRYRGFIKATSKVDRRVTKTTTAGGQQCQGALGKHPRQFSSYGGQSSIVSQICASVLDTYRVPVEQYGLRFQGTRPPPIASIATDVVLPIARHSNHTNCPVDATHNLRHPTMRSLHVDTISLFFTCRGCICHTTGMLRLHISPSTQLHTM